jgi:hypothetical protein
MAQNASRIFSEERIIFYGLDFSKAKIAIPDAKPNEIKDDYFVLWNEAVATDNERFNKESALQKVSVPVDLAVVERRNAAASISEMQANPDVTLLKSTIEHMIDDYTDGTRKEGIGFVIIVESISKKRADAIAHLVFFDIATRKVLLSKRMNGPAGGHGLKSYWTRPFQTMFEKMTAGLFDMWKKEVVGK